MTILTTIISIGFIKLWNEENISDISLLIPEGNSVILDESNKEIANLSSIYQSYTPFEEIPEVMINAIVAIEDSRFFSHEGIDIKGILRALTNNIKNKGYHEGASTITQQLIKNIYLSNEKTIERKINEAILALKLETIFSKEDILASYLSNVLFGGRIYGIKMAMKYYFNKELKDITLAEASLLAGLVQMPNYYNPFKNYDNATKRRNIVLNKMLDLGYIDQDEYEKTLKIELKSYLNKGEINEEIGIYADYIDYVLDVLSNEYEINPYQSSINVNIPVNSEIQKYLYEIMHNKYNIFPDDLMECGIIVIDNYTSNILAISGSRSKGLRNLNYATSVYNQPGSTIKPFISYAPAFFYKNYQLILLYYLIESSNISYDFTSSKFLFSNLNTRAI